MAKRKTSAASARANMGRKSGASSAAKTDRSSAPKSIVLFSDGTGNSSAQLFKTNVWRMYEAVELGPPAKGKRHQISYYDDGVGTSSFKPLAMLGGAFGWGLKRNVLDLYRYACRNYRPGDEIYGFGFSRGAFTMRLTISLIASQGLVKSGSEAELDRRSRYAYRAFRASFLPRRLQWPTKLFRRLRDGIVGWRSRRRGDAPYRTAGNHKPVIRFIGVWDTVSAYGGPITEITRAIDNWVYPLSMPNYQLSERVERARHALSIDDERDAFHPLLWDEIEERQRADAAEQKQKMACDDARKARARGNRAEVAKQLGKAAKWGAEKRRFRRRLEQVWFTGMHADVGGGYPDESLSYVSLLWMMEEAEEVGLRTLTVVKDRFVALASSYGPIHDSRAGVGAYYRYQPRKISAWTDPVETSTISLRDPVIVDDAGKSKGLLCTVKVHESVINRIATGTDRYAPITLPPNFAIVPPQRKGENVPQADSDDPDVAQETDSPKPMVSPELRARLADPDVCSARAAALERMWNLVWYRRLTYFLTLTATLALVILPMVVERLPDPPFLADGRTWIGGIIRMLTLAVPAFADDWVQVYADNPFYFLILAVLIWILLTFSSRLERKLRDGARGVWQRSTTAGQAPKLPAASSIERFRNGRGYQSFVQFFKWIVLPDVVFAPLIVLFLLWLGVSTFAQAGLPFLENSTQLCRPSGTQAEANGVRFDLRTDAACSASYGRVVESERYVVRFNVVDEWYDASRATTPQGLSAGDISWGLGYLAAPLRRVIDAGFLQPIIEVRPTDEEDDFFRNVQIYPLAVRRVGESPNLYEAEFVAPRSGELFLFVNDAMLPLAGSIWGPFDYRYFYERSGFGAPHERGNRGTACITVERPSARSGRPPVRLEPPAPGSICARAAARDAAQAEAEAKAQAQAQEARPTSAAGPTSRVQQ